MFSFIFFFAILCLVLLLHIQYDLFAKKIHLAYIQKMITIKKISSKFAKKINKTKEARTGKGIYKRRNSRDYRAIIFLDTYNEIIKNDPDQLNIYKRGYAVRVNPNEYFDSDGNRRQDFPKSLELGENSFLYFKDIKDWKSYGKFCDGFEEVVELSTNHSGRKRSWYGEYCLFINNTKPEKKSLICGSGNTNQRAAAAKQLEDELLNKLEKYGDLSNFEIDKKFPSQAGLGNFDYDYATPDEANNVCDQLTYMALKIPDFKSTLESQNDSITIEDIDEFEKEITKKCQDKKLLDFRKLSDIGAWDEINNCPICPLCKVKISADEFLETASQVDGRKEEDNTRAEIVLMHIKALRPGEFNHRTYNLGWGHMHCNAIQSDNTIDETLEDLKRILKNNNIYTL